jgi:hypothetical protein
VADPSSWGFRAIQIVGEWERGTMRTYEADDFTWLDWIDERPFETYSWTIATRLPYDLAAIRHPVDVLRFVKSWGLLHSYDDEDENPILPTVEEFMHESLHINWLLTLYGFLRPGHDHEATRRSLAEYMVGIFMGEFARSAREWLTDPQGRNVDLDLIERYARGADVEQMQIDVRDILQQELHESPLRNVELSLGNLDDFESSPTEGSPPGDFALSVLPRDLLARTYAELAMQMTEGIPVATCPVDGSVFAVRDPRQIYCTTQCAGRARYRRFAEKRKKT